jgi:hypothetical protein
MSSSGMPTYFGVLLISARVALVAIFRQTVARGSNK